MSSVAQTFPPAASSVGAARRFAVATLALWDVAQVEDDVRTVVSELATNAVLHARTPFTLTVARIGACLRVSVSDGSALRPRLRRFGDLDSTTGRGLRLIAQLSTAWGVEPDGDGKSTWCELATDPGAGGDDDRHDARPDDGVRDDVDVLLARYADDDGGSGRAPRDQHGRAA